jgi:hypothetical protein
MALLLTLVLASGAAAHHPTGVTITPSCSAGKADIDVGYGAFSGGHVLHVTIEVGSKHYEADYVPLDAEGTFSIQKPLPRGTTTITVTAQARTPEGQDEGSPVSATRTVTCRTVTLLPSLRFLGPCDDPMHAVKFRNPTGHALRAVFHWKHAITRTWHDTRLLVPAHSTRTTGWKHVLGNSHMTARIGSVVRHAESAAPGNYRACWLAR